MDSNLGSCGEGLSFSDIERMVLQLRRAVALSEEKGTAQSEGLLRSRVSALSHDERAALAAELVSSGAVSQRHAYELTGISRDTIRRTVRGGATPDKRK